jgi:hypothetical protein
LQQLYGTRSIALVQTKRVEAVGGVVGMLVDGLAVGAVEGLLDGLEEGLEGLLVEGRLVVVGRVVVEGRFVIVGSLVGEGGTRARPEILNSGVWRLGGYNINTVVSTLHIR